MIVSFIKILQVNLCIKYNTYIIYHALHYRTECLYIYRIQLFPWWRFLTNNQGSLSHLAHTKARSWCFESADADKETLLLENTWYPKTRMSGMLVFGYIYFRTRTINFCSLIICLYKNFFHLWKRFYLCVFLTLKWLDLLFRFL